LTTTIFSSQNIGGAKRHASPRSKVGEILCVKRYCVSPAQNLGTGGHVSSPPLNSVPDRKLFLVNVILIFYCANTTELHMPDWKFLEGDR